MGEICGDKGSQTHSLASNLRGTPWCAYSRRIRRDFSLLFEGRSNAPWISNGISPDTNPKGLSSHFTSVLGVVPSRLLLLEERTSAGRFLSRFFLIFGVFGGGRTLQSVGQVRGFCKDRRGCDLWRVLDDWQRVFGRWGDILDDILQELSTGRAGW